MSDADITRACQGGEKKKRTTDVAAGPQRCAEVSPDVRIEIPRVADKAVMVSMAN